MSDQDLGKYSEGFANFRKILAAVPEPVRLKVYMNAAAEAAKYVSKGLDRTVAADELTDMAIAHGLNDPDAVQFIISEAFKKIDEPERVPDDLDEAPATNGHDKQAPPPTLIPREYIIPDPNSIPPRRWLFGMHYVRGVVTATVAPGGFGKTSLSLFEAMEMVKLGYRVWYVSAEDDRDELDRRIAAYVERHGLTPMQMARNFFVDDKMSFPFKIAKNGKNGMQFDEPRLLAFEQAIKHNRIDVVILDPLISFHQISENDTTSMDALVKRLGEICARQQCCIELSHHVRKPNVGQLEITVHDARGAGAIVNAVRSCRVINQMSIIEAQQAQIDLDQRAFYLRVDSGKRNMAPPERAGWTRLISVGIANGDNVQALERYDYPKVFSKLTTADVEWIKQLLRVKDYRVDPRSGDWLGLAVAERFGRNPKDNAGDSKWIKTVLATWEKNKVLKRVERPDEHRNQRWFYTSIDQDVRDLDLVEDGQQDMGFDP